jgi:predicted alpha/beta superfamily hydrolase
MRSSLGIVLLLVAVRSFSPSHLLTIRVHAPADTPDSATLFVAGNLPALGAWQPDGLRMTKGDSSIWTATIVAPGDTLIEFKVTLGDWDEEALYVASAIPGNERLILRADTTIDLFPVTWKHIGYKPPGGITGTVRYHHGLMPKGLKYARQIIVWLPPSYDSAPLRRYPVLYMHDGRNIIDPRTAFGANDWHMDEVADSLIRCGAMEEIIIVGISSSPDRSLEYSDTSLGRAYASFVVSQLKPMIDSTYRTKPDRANTAVMGSSMGGLISFLFVWWHPEVFSKAACLSSAFRWDHNKMIREVEATRQLPRDIMIYMDCGTAGVEQRLRAGYQRMHEILEERGLKEGKTLMGFLDEGADHTERAWASRVWRPLEFFFPATHKGKDCRPLITIPE